MELASESGDDEAINLRMTNYIDIATDAQFIIGWGGVREKIGGRRRTFQIILIGKECSLTNSIYQERTNEWRVTTLQRFYLREPTLRQSK